LCLCYSLVYFPKFPCSNPLACNRICEILFAARCYNTYTAYISVTKHCCQNASWLVNTTSTCLNLVSLLYCNRMISISCQHFPYDLTTNITSKDKNLVSYFKIYTDICSCIVSTPEFESRLRDRLS